MRSICLFVLAGAICAPAFPSWAQAPLTLDEAWQRAEAVNPSLRIVQGAKAAFEGMSTDARAPLWNNPSLSTSLMRRKFPGPIRETATEWNAGIAQTFEIAGQQGARRKEANELLSAADSSVAAARVALRAEVEQRFVRVLGLQSRIAMEAQAVKLIDDVANAVDKRVQAGEDSRLDGNVSRVEAERARNQLSLLTEDLVRARAELGVALQLSPKAVPEVAGELDRPQAPYSIDDLLGTAAKQPALRALEARETAAQARLRLERASAYPDVTVGLETGREGPTDLRESVGGVTLVFPLPLFRRNATGIGKATADLTQVQVERAAAMRDTAAQVRALWERRNNLQSRIARLNAEVVARLEENQRLSTVAFRSGEIGLTQLLLVNRQLLEGRRDLLDARVDLRLTEVELEAISGWQGVRP